MTVEGDHSTADLDAQGNPTGEVEVVVGRPPGAPDAAAWEQTNPS
ncbi:hypothetical protein [Ilumatobacter nonamiensis]|nr:hypothetical protein [Ilumatobacter nonamiensis]